VIVVSAWEGWESLFVLLPTNMLCTNNAANFDIITYIEKNVLLHTPLLFELLNININNRNDKKQTDRDTPLGHKKTSVQFSSRVQAVSGCRLKNAQITGHLDAGQVEPIDAERLGRDERERALGVGLGLLDKCVHGPGGHLHTLADVQDAEFFTTGNDLEHGLVIDGEADEFQFAQFGQVGHVVHIGLKVVDQVQLFQGREELVESRAQLLRRTINAQVPELRAVLENLERQLQTRRRARGQLLPTALVQQA